MFNTKKGINPGELLQNIQSNPNNSNLCSTGPSPLTTVPFPRDLTRTDLRPSNWIYFYNELKIRSFHHTSSEVTGIMKYEQRRQPVMIKKFKNNMLPIMVKNVTLSINVNYLWHGTGWSLLSFSWPLTTNIKIPSKCVIPGFKTFSISVFYLLPSIIIIIIIINLSIIITLLSTIISSIILSRLLVFHNDILKLNNISKYNCA